MTLTFSTNRVYAEYEPNTWEAELAVTPHPVIQCHQVTKSFDENVALREVSLGMEAGEILALVGPSGSGKTTLLRLVAGLEAPDSGTLTLENRLVAGGGSWVPPEGRHLGLVFQDYALFPHLTVAQNVSFGLKDRPRNARTQAARRMLEMVRLDHLAERYPYQLSGGEQQRVALARSLAPQPLALLLDEPFSNLDPELRAQLRAEVRHILRSGSVTAIYVTHDQEEALFMGDRVAVMNAGALEQVGTPEHIFHHPQTRFVARFIGTADFIPATATEDGLVTEVGVLHPPLRLPVGTEVAVMVRPGDLTVRPSERGPGWVMNRVFRGMHYLYTLSLPSGTLVHSLQHHSAYYPQGTPVDVCLAPNQTLTCFIDSDRVPGLEAGSCFSASTVESARADA